MSKAAAAKRARTATKDRSREVTDEAKLYTNPPLPKAAVKTFAGALVDRKYCDDPVVFSAGSPHTGLAPNYTNR